MKECELVEDLLPLYLENLLGDAATGFVKTHLAGCLHCKQLYDKLSLRDRSSGAETMPPTEKEKSIGKIISGYQKWFYTIMAIAVICSLIGGIAGTYFTMKYEEMVPGYIAQDFVKFALKGDRWTYQERLSQVLKESLPFEKYSKIKTWEEFEQTSKQVKPAGLKIYKQVTAQEYGPFEVDLKVGLVLEKGGFRVFEVIIKDKEEYLKKKRQLEQALEEKNLQGKDNVAEIDKQYVDFPPANPAQGEYFVEGRILKITDNQVFIEQHMDTHSVPTASFHVAEDTGIVRHYIVKDRDYYRKIDFKELKAGDVIFVIFTKEKVPRIVALT